MIVMIKLIKVTPFILLLLYYLIMDRFQIDWIYKVIILGIMIIVSVFTFLKTTKKIKWNKNTLYLFLGISSVFLLMIYFNNVA